MLTCAVSMFPCVVFIFTNVVFMFTDVLFMFTYIFCIYLQMFCLCLHVLFFFNFCRPEDLSVGTLIPLFWTSFDISSGFQSQSG